MDRARLEYEIKKNGMSPIDICDRLSISRSSYYRKISGASEFTQGEIQKLIDVLNLESPMGIFLAKKCPKRHNSPIYVRRSDGKEVRE